MCSIREEIFTNWNSEQYLKFAAERAQPCTDLLQRLSGTYTEILDLGCGPGNSTAQLQKAFPKAHITGLDADEAMLTQARQDYPAMTFCKGTAPESLAAFPQSFDLVFSNACIHWIPEQERLLKTVSEKLTLDGVFAVQIPLTSESKFYKMLYSLVEQRWQTLQAVHNFHNLDATGYYNTLLRFFRSVTIWRTDYYHVVDSKSSVLEWYKGSGLRPYLQQLEASEQAAFLAELQEQIDQSYTSLQDGKVFLVMPRLFFVAGK